MSLQIRVSEVVGEWLAVPLTQRNNFRHFSRLLNPRSLMINSAKAIGVNQTITDDIDFITVPGLHVFTANPRALDTAKDQNKLINRSVTPYQRPKAKALKLNPEKA